MQALGLQGEGFHYNELTGDLSSAELTLGPLIQSHSSTLRIGDKHAIFNAPPIKLIIPRVSPRS